MSGAASTLLLVTEASSSEVEKVLLYISDARERARRAKEDVLRHGADAHVVTALASTEQGLGELHRRLTQGTYYAVPDSPEQLAV